jgi:hypothetical protein
VVEKPLRLADDPPERGQLALGRLLLPARGAVRPSQARTSAPWTSLCAIRIAVNTGAVAFDSAFSKLARAREHLADVRRAVDVFTDVAPLAIIREHEATLKGMDWIVHAVYKVRVPDSDEIPLIAGDVVHSARTALDHVAYELCKSRTRRTAFPILATAPKPKDKLLDLKLDGMPKPAQGSHC